MKLLSRLSGKRIICFGCGWLLGSVAFAAFNPWWQANVLIAFLILGLGIGLGDWKGGE